MDPISRTMRTSFLTTRSKNNHPLQHPHSIPTVIASANPSVSTEFKKEKQLMLAAKWNNCWGFTIQQYKIHLDGSGRIIPRNRKQIKPTNSEIKTFIIPSATPPSQPIPNKPTSPNHNETTIDHAPTTQDTIQQQYHTIIMVADLKI